MSSAVEAGETFTAGIAQRLFPLPDMVVSDSSEWGRDWDLSPDGQHILTVRDEVPLSGQTQLVVVINWFEELEHLVSSNP